jgi:hypothetical protein
MVLSGREADLAEIAAALSVASSSAPIWEAQALIIDYCSSRAGDPAPQWATLAGLDPYEVTWQRLEGIAGFIGNVQPAVPYGALVSAGQVMSRAFQPATLDGLGYLVARLPDWDECLVICENSTDRSSCMQNCLSGRLT